MGQKVNPHGLRVGIIKDWDSRWYAEDAFADNLVEDDKIRKYVKKRLYNAGISKIEIERASDRVKLIVYTAKPGVVIGKGGAEIEKVKAELQKFTDKKLVVPGKTLIEISKILSGEAENVVSISYTKNHIVFEFDNTIVVSRLIEGEYFRIDQMLSNDYETKVRINKKELLNCIDRATLLVKEGDKKPIIINIGDELMELKIKSQIGSMNEEIMITKEGKDLLIGFNPKFLIDALRVIDDEEVTIYLMNAKAPCFIKDDGESYIYLILPVNFNAAA